MANIFQQYLQPAKSVMDYTADMDQADARKNALQQAALSLQDSQMKLDVGRQEVAANNALSRYLAQGMTPDQVAANMAQQGYGKQALAYTKLQQDLNKGKADVEHLNAQTGETKSKTAKSDYDLTEAKRQKAITDIASFTDPKQAAASLQLHIQSGDISPEQGQMIMQTIPQNPADFPRWQIGMLQRIMTAKESAAQIAPDANARLQSETSIKTNAATNATSRANNQATIQKDLSIAGVVPGGGLDQNSERTAQAIASGQMPAPTGMALLNPKNQRILGRVMEINPQYDYTEVAAKKKAASDFTTGTLGNSMRSFAVAGQHLDQLGQLVDAMNNGNSQLVNRIANAYSQQTGNPAVTNFDAAKDVVSKEVIKAIVAGGGGVSERQELSDLMKNTKSPAQLKGVIAQYRNLMAAQHDALLQQRRAAGLKDSTLPNYADANGSASAVPATNSKGWTLHRDANGNQAYVSPDGKQYEEVK